MIITPAEITTAYLATLPKDKQTLGTEPYTSHIRFERRGNALVPVRVRRQPDDHGKTRTIRVTELSFPLAANVEADNDHERAIELDGLRTPKLNSRDTLLASGMLQTASSYPMGAAYLALDPTAWEWHAHDMAAGWGGCDNPWVRELYGKAESEESADNED